MSTSTKPDVTNNFTLINWQKENVAEKGKMKGEKELIKFKELKLYELAEWLEKCGHKVTDRTKEIKIKEIEFQSEIYPLLPYPSSGLNTPLILEFQDDLDGGFMIRTTFSLDKDIDRHLENQKSMARETALTYMEIERLVMFLKVSQIKFYPLIYPY